MDPLPTRLAQRHVHAGHVITVTVDRVRLPGGHELELDQVRHPGAAAVVPVDAQGNVFMVRQVRYATGGWLLEIPAGKRDGAEDPAACAARELAEEVGMRAATLTPLGAVWTTPGFCNEQIWLYLATDLTPTPQHLDADEVLEVVELPWREALAMAADGRIDDAKTALALLRAQAHLTTR